MKVRDRGGWFINSLDKVTIPILMLTAEHDQITTAWNAEVALKSIPDQPQATFRSRMQDIFLS
jgi:poly(3-hydroxyalkanoate) synthetase